MVFCVSGIDITPWVYDFEVEDGGLRNPPQLTVRLHNSEGMFTSSGLYRTLLNDGVFVKADVGYGLTTIFNGRVFDKDDDFIQGAPDPKSVLTLICRSETGNRLNRDTTSQPYYDRGWSVSGALVHMLSGGSDSTFPVGVTLDINPVNPMGSGLFPDNNNHISLLESLQNVCEEYDYLGWLDDCGLIAHLRKFSVPDSLSGAVPTIRYILVSGLPELTPKVDMEEVYNHIICWGADGGDVGFPSVDHWTEDPITRLYAAWIPGSGCVLSDDFNIFRESGYLWSSLRVIMSGVTSPWATLDIPSTGYIQPQVPHGNMMDLNDDRFVSLNYWHRQSVPYPWIVTRLRDNVGDVVQNVTIAAYAANTWYNQNLSVLIANHGLPTWTLISGGAFDWSNTQEIEIFSSPNSGYMWLDVLRFVGRNWSLDPFTQSGLIYDPAHTNAWSIGFYGRSVYHMENSEINCYEHLWAEGERVLAQYKNPFNRISITKGAKVWLHPTQTVQVAVPAWEISGVYRVEELTHRFSSETKLLRTTVNLVNEDATIGTSLIQRESVGGLWEKPREP